MSPWKRWSLTFDTDRQVDEAFARLIHEPWGHSLEAEWRPEVDLYEGVDGYVLVVDAPGVKPADFEIQVEPNSITVAGHRDVERWIRNGLALHRERKSGSFSRTLPLGQPVDPPRVTTSFEHGLFVVRLLKSKG